MDREKLICHVRREGIYVYRGKEEGWEIVRLPEKLMGMSACPMKDGVSIFVCGVVKHQSLAPPPAQFWMADTMGQMPENTFGALRRDVVMGHDGKGNPKYLDIYPDTPMAFIYDTASRTLSQAPNPPYITHYASCVSMPAGGVFVCGGKTMIHRDGWWELDTAAIFKDGDWRTVRAKMATKRHQHLCVVMEDKKHILIVSGERAGFSCEVFDMHTQVFSPVADIKLGNLMGAAGLAMSGNRVMVFGGSSRSKAKWTGRYATVYDFKADAWSWLEPMITERYIASHAVLSTDAKTITVYGGYVRDGVIKPPDIYDVEKNAWAVDTVHVPPPSTGVMRDSEYWLNGVNAMEFVRGEGAVFFVNRPEIKVDEDDD